MVKKSLFSAFCVALVMSLSAFGQVNEASIKPTTVMGEVVTVDAAKIVVKTQNGQWEGVITDKTEFHRVSPEHPTDLKGAAPAVVGDIGVGDKIVLTALMARDGKYNVRNLYLMTKADLTAKSQKDSEKWRNGISGRVASVKAESNQLIVESGGVMNKTTLTITPKADAKFIRYAPESVKFADARSSSIAEIKPGDQIRAIGDKGADGTTFAADEVLTGGFRQSAGTIKSLDVEKKEAVIKDITTGKDVTVSFADAVFLKRFPAEMAQRMASFQGGGGGMAGGVRPPGGGGVMPPNGGGQVVVTQGGGQGNGGQPGQGGGFRGGNLDAMVDRLPNIAATDLKAGDMIAVLTAEHPSGADHVKALKLLAGVEPFVEIAQRQAAMAGARGAANSPNFNIPGLDGGIGLP